MAVVYRQRDGTLAMGELEGDAHGSFVMMYHLCCNAVSISLYVAKLKGV